MPRDRDGRAMTVGVDTGGTFTDVVVRVGGRTEIFKVLSTPRDPAEAVVVALAEATEIFDLRRVHRLTYGTTVATNAMLERRGARSALVTTTGFEDVLEIGRQVRPNLYDLEPQKVAPLIPRRYRLGVRERTLYDGEILTPLAAGEVTRLLRALRSLRVESVAISLLHSPANARHELALTRALATLGVPVSASSTLAPQPGEYERSSTTVANAYVRPVVEKHLRSLARRTRARTLRVMQSNGGAIGVVTAGREPIRTMLSGPAGGVAAAAAVARLAGCASAITLDMGGTSTDVSLVDRSPMRRATTEIGGIPIRTPSLAIHTVGAGGGSLASVDQGGALRVGPGSAGADPGPACYGRGHAATVTDANVVLGRLRPEVFLGGHMPLDARRAERALSSLARTMGARSATAAAEGVVRVVENTMARAIRKVTVERGRDPRGSVLVPFGGAAGLHACGLAEDLDIREILVPPDPGLLSAFGMLDADLVRDAYRTLRLAMPSYDDLVRAAAPLARRARRDLLAEGLTASRVRIEAYAELRYAGEGSTLDVPLVRDFVRRFHTTHRLAFHSADPARPIECCGVRVTAIAAGERARTPRRAPTSRRRSAVVFESAEITLQGKRVSLPQVPRSVLTSRDRVKGPALVTEYSSTVLLRAGWTLRVDERRNLRLSRGRS